MGIDLKESMARLKAAGYKIESETQTLSEIGRQNAVSPQQVYLVIKPAAKQPTAQLGKTQKLPDEPPTGTGNFTLADLCSQYNLNIKVISRGLAKEGLQFSEELTIKKIGEKNQVSPIDIYEKIKAVAAAQPE